MSKDITWEVVVFEKDRTVGQQLGIVYETVTTAEWYGDNSDMLIICYTDNIDNKKKQAYWPRENIYFITKKQTDEDKE